MPETWNLFCCTGHPVRWPCCRGFLAVIYTISRASFNVDQRERVLKYAADKKRETEEKIQSNSPSS